MQNYLFRLLYKKYNTRTHIPGYILDVLMYCSGDLYKLLVQESDTNLLTIIKGTSIYRHTSYNDVVKDYLPPSLSEYKKEYEDHW